LRARGVESIVVLLHQGAVPADPTAYDACNGVTGPAVDIAQELSPRIDAVVSGHTHQPYNCMVDDAKGQPRLLTSASALGRMVTDVHLLVNPRTGNVVREAAYAQNRIVTNTGVAPVAKLTRLVNTFRRLVAPIAGQVIGHTTSGTVSREQNAAGESPLGDLIADSQLADESVVAPGGEAPEIAFMNPGGIRDDLVTNADNAVTYGAAFTVQPFNNFLVSMDLTGAQIDTLLEQQFSGANESFAKVLQVSAGFSYTWDASATAGSKVDQSTIQLNGETIDANATYRIVVNNFLSDGGDGFVVLTEGQNKYVGGLDIDALADYLAANDPYDPTSGDARITRVN
jgi:5'-nucleotidase